MRSRLPSFLRRPIFPPVLRSGAVALLALGLAGCIAPKATPIPTPQQWPLANLRAAERLPASIVRVAVLPVATALHLPEEQLAPLDAAWLQALAQTGRVETIAISREQLMAWFGVRQLGTGGLLPADLLPVLAARTGAQAVTFVDLTTYSAYPPLTLGLRARLTQLADGATLWACEEVFDSRDPQLVRAVEATGRTAGDRTAAPTLHSPRRLAAFATGAFAASWPTR